MNKWEKLEEDISQELEEASDKYWQEVRSIARKVYYQEVVPFCNRRGWEFFSDNEVYIFLKAGEPVHPEDLPNDKPFQALSKLLETDVPVSKGHTLGVCMPKYLVIKRRGAKR